MWECLTASLENFHQIFMGRQNYLKVLSLAVRVGSQRWGSLTKLLYHPSHQSPQ